MATPRSSQMMSIVLCVCLIGGALFVTGALAQSPWAGAFIKKVDNAAPKATHTTAARRGATDRNIAMTYAPATPLHADDYILGPGDLLEVQIRCARPEGHEVQVTAEGTVLIPNGAFPVKRAAGLSLAEFRDEMQLATDRLYVEAKFDVVIKGTRTFPAEIYGHVEDAGTFEVNGLTRVWDLIQHARTIEGGSTVQAKLLRNGQEMVLDLGAIRMGDAASNIMLQAGDRIHVPPIGPQVTLAGCFRNAGVHEIRPREGLSSLLTRVGGPSKIGALEAAYVQRVNGGGQITRVACNLQELLKDSPLLNGYIVRKPTSEAPEVTVEGAPVEYPPIGIALPSKDDREDAALDDLELQDGDYVWLPQARERAGRVRMAGEINLLRDLPAEPDGVEIDEQKLPDVKIKYVSLGDQLRETRLGKDESGKPIVKPAEHEWVVEVPMEEGLKLSDALRAVNGPTARASLRNASIVRLTEDERLIQVAADFVRVWRGQDPAADVELERGDLIRIPSVDQYAETVNLRGQIAGFEEDELRTFQLVEGWSASTLLACAGGATPIASPANAEVRRHTADGSMKTIRVNLEAGEDVALQARDTLYVPSAEKYMPTIRIVGEFFHQDFTFTAEGKAEETESIGGDKYLLYKFRHGETVGDVLRDLGGPLATVDREEVYLIRESEEGEDATIPINVGEVWDERNREADVALQAGDTLVLPTIVQHVYVVGQVRKPGPYAYRHGYRLADYVSGAGGMLPEAKERAVKILRKGEDGTPEMIHLDMRKGQRRADIDVALEPGDIIVVPRSQISGMRDMLELVGKSSAAFLIYDRLSK
jgi:protein involved in polysaccharide export with SLBB domain